MKNLKLVMFSVLVLAHGTNALAGNGQNKERIGMQIRQMLTKDPEITAYLQTLIAESNGTRAPSINGNYGTRSQCTSSGKKCLIYATLTTVKGNLISIGYNPYSISVDSGLSGIQAATQICQSEALARFGSSAHYEPYVINSAGAMPSLGSGVKYINTFEQIINQNADLTPDLTLDWPILAGASIAQTGYPSLSGYDPSQDSCNNWTSISESAYKSTGNTGSINGFSSDGRNRRSWVSAEVKHCGDPVPLYCIEQIS